VACHRVDSEYDDDISQGEVQKGYHCVWQIHYQLVFPVKYRKTLLDEMVVKIIEETAEGIQECYAIEMEALGMDQDHIHLLCGTHPKISPGEIVRVFKTLLPERYFKGILRIKKELWGGEFWSDGYYVATVGERGKWSKVEEYVQRQGKPKEYLKQIKLF
jgi:putative transposase